MTKKGLLSICSVMLLLITVIAIIYYLNVPIVTMNRNVSNGEQVASGSGLKIDTAKEVLVIYGSKVKDGNLTIRLTDENWNTIKEFQANEYGKEKIHLEIGKYYIRVESDYFKGNYRVKVYD